MVEDDCHTPQLSPPATHFAIICRRLSELRSNTYQMEVKIFLLFYEDNTTSEKIGGDNGSIPFIEDMLLFSQTRRA